LPKKHSNFISLYPLSPDEALRAALWTPPEKKQAIRAAMEITKDKVEIFEEETEDKNKPKKERTKTEK
jgi:hypothetical protein